MKHGLICDTSVKHLHVPQLLSMINLHLQMFTIIMNMPRGLMHFSASFFCVIQLLFCYSVA